MSAPRIDPRFKDEARDLLDDVSFEDKWHEDECVSIVSEILDECATLRERYAEAVRALEDNKLDGEIGCCVGCGGSDDDHAPDCAVHAVLSRPEAQEVLRG